MSCKASCSEWVWRVGCTLVYRPWQHLGWADQINLRGEILLSRDWVTSTRLNVWVCLHLSASTWILLAPVFLLLICSFPKCGNDSTCNWRVGCTLVYRPWPTSWLSRRDKFGRENIIVQRLGHVNKADCLSRLASHHYLHLLQRRDTEQQYTLPHDNRVSLRKYIKLN